MKSKKYIKIRLTALIIIFVICFFFSFTLGRYPITPIELIKISLSRIFPIKQTWTQQMETILFQIRFPRVVMACLIGSALSCAGAAYQGIFQNPMVSPDILGASAGAGFGAALAIFLSFSYLGISLTAFFFGMGSVLLVYIVSRYFKTNPILGLVLTGIMVSSLFSSATSFIKLVADPNDKLPAITYWLMGSLASIRGQDVAFTIIPIIVGITPIYLWRWKINVLTMGDEEARTMGVNVQSLRMGIIIFSTLITATCVSVSGLIGWVGLVIPHFARMIVGNDYRYMLPASLLLGGSYLLIVDNISRLISTSEIPIGILTAFVGAPFFLFLIIREGNRI